MSLILLLVGWLTLPFQSNLDSIQHHNGIVIRSIRVQGNERTKEAIIFRELPIAIGDTIATEEAFKEAIKRCQSNVLNTYLFLTVEVKEENREDNQSDIVIEVKEKWYLLILPIFYLSDRNFNEWWYTYDRDIRRTVYGLQIQHFNLSGNNDKLVFKAYGGFKPYFELSYGRPYIDKKQRMGLRGGVAYATQRSMPYRTWNDKFDFIDTRERMREQRAAFLELKLRNSLYHFHTLYASYLKTSVADTVNFLNPNYLNTGTTKQDYAFLRYDYRYDKRDNKQYSLKGEVVVIQAIKYGLLPKDDVNQLSFSAIYQNFFPIKGKFYGDISLSTKVSFPKLQSYILTQGLGYSNQLIRGYELYVIDGQDYLLGKTNLKYELLNKVLDLKKVIRVKQFNTMPISAYATTYLDAGYVRNYYPEFSNTKLGNRSLLGGGFGLDIVTFYDNIFRLNYSFNQLGEHKFFIDVVRTL